MVAVTKLRIKAESMQFSLDEAVAYHNQQILSIVQTGLLEQKPQYRERLGSLIGKMENGLLAKIFPTATARANLKKMVEERQRQPEGTEGWFVGCLAESLAFIRLATVQDRSGVMGMDYNLAKTLILNPPASKSQGG